MAKQRGALSVAAALSAVVLAAACGMGAPSEGNPGQGGKEGEAGTQPMQPEAAKEKVELTVYYPYGGFTLEQFMASVGGFIQKKYPNVSFNLIVSGQGTTLQDMVASRTPIDLIYGAPLADLKNIAYLDDLTDLTKKYGFDLQRLNPSVLDAQRSVTGGPFSAFPTHINFYTLMYNKDIFDKFGVAYLRDGMNWDELHEVAKKLTRQDGGVTYYGFGLDGPATNLPLNQLGLPLVDAQKKRAAFLSAPWHKLFDNYKRFYSMPGYDSSFLGQEYNRFVKERTVAILETLVTKYPAADTGFSNWDLARYPTFVGEKDYGPQPNPVYLAVPVTSKHREAAFLAAMEVLSDEAQASRARRGIVTSLNDRQKIMRDFGIDLPALQGKNAAALSSQKMETVTRPANDDRTARLENAAKPFIAAAFQGVMTSASDTNTILREQEEKANQAFAQIE